MTIILSGSQIQEVTASGLKYLDANGQEQYIDFNQCYENYVRKWMSAEYQQHIKAINNMTDDRLSNVVERAKQIKQIGIRQVLTPPWADGPYLEFYTEPHIRFKFETRDEYDEVLQTIEDASWNTFDQS
jgi:hypothetical protein